MLSSIALRASKGGRQPSNFKAPQQPFSVTSPLKCRSSRMTPKRNYSSKSKVSKHIEFGRTFTSSSSSRSHPRIVLSEEQEMECVTVPTMFHLGRAIKTVNLLRNLDKFGRPLGVAVSDDAPGTPDMLGAIDILPNRSFLEILEADAAAAGYTMDKRQGLDQSRGLANYPLPTDEIPAQFKSSAWKHWYNFMEQHVWHKPTQAKRTDSWTAGSNIPPTREAFLSTMRGALTQAVQHFPSVLSGTIPLESVSGGHETKTKSWLRIGQGYFDAGSLQQDAINDIMSMRSEENHYEEVATGGEHKSRQYPAEEFRWIHFSPEDPRLLYISQPPPLSLIYQQVEKHLLLTQKFTLVPHQLEVYGEGVETLPRMDPLDPNFLGTVIISLPTADCKGGAIKLTNLNHTPHQGAAEVPDEDLSRIDSDLSCVLSNLHLSQHDSAAASSSSSAASEAPSPLELDLDRLESDLASPTAPAAGQQQHEWTADSLSHASTSGNKGTVGYQNWSNFTWTPYGISQSASPPTEISTGSGVQFVSTTESSCEPSGLSWIAFSKNVPYSIDKVESGSRVLLTYHIIGKTSTNTTLQQPTASEINLSASSSSHLESKINTPLVNALFSPKMRQAGISKLVSLVAYYFNHAHKGSWLSHGEDDLTTLGIALRDTYAPEILEAEELIGSDAWLYNIFKWACSPASGIFHHPMRVLLAPIAMIHQGQLGHPHLHPKPTMDPPTDKGKKHSSTKFKKSNEIEVDTAEAANTGSHRWETHQEAPPSNLVYFLNLEGWEHEGPVLSHDAYADCARFSSLPARPLSSMERTIYGTDHHPSNARTEWHSVPILYGQRWGDELDNWEAAPILPKSSTKKESTPESFHVVGRKTFATTALIIQKIPSTDHENQL